MNPAREHESRYIEKIVCDLNLHKIVEMRIQTEPILTEQRVKIC